MGTIAGEEAAISMAMQNNVDGLDPPGAFSRFPGASIMYSFIWAWRVRDDPFRRFSARAVAGVDAVEAAAQRQAGVSDRAAVRGVAPHSGPCVRVQDILLLQKIAMRDDSGPTTRASKVRPGHAGPRGRCGR